MSNRPMCLCGCGQRTKGGRFKPGHDAKLHGKLADGTIKGNKEQWKVFRANGWKKH